MEAIEAILRRRSVRSFLQKPLQKSDEETLKKAALSAPSAGNLQSRFFYFVKDPNKKAAIKKASLNQECLDAPLVVVICADAKCASCEYGLRGQELYSIQDASASAENILVAAVALGLGGCWVGSFKEGAIIEILDIPQNLRPVALIPVGYTKENPGPKDLKPLETKVKFV